MYDIFLDEERCEWRKVPRSEHACRDGMCGALDCSRCGDELMPDLLSTKSGVATEREGDSDDE